VRSDTPRALRNPARRGATPIQAAKPREARWLEAAGPKPRENGAVLEQAVRRMARYLARRGLLGGDGVDSREGDDGETEPTLAQGHAALCASAASGQSPPAGPELRRRGTSLAPLVGKPLAFDKPLCASVDGFTLHAATRAGGLDARAREAGSRS